MFSAHYRKRLNFRGPIFFREPAHEKHTTFSVGFETDQKDHDFSWATKVADEKKKISWAMTRPTKKMGRGPFPGPTRFFMGHVDRRKKTTFLWVPRWPTKK